MSLFLVGDEGAVPFQRLDSPADVTQRDPSLASVLWGDLSRVLGQKLFKICFGLTPRVGGESTAAPRPAIVALDPEGSIVVIYVRELLDGQALAQCLECVGWARSTSLSELAQLYWRGPEKFWDEWQRFADMRAPGMVGTKQRMVVVSSESQPHVRSALGFLMDNSLPIATLSGQMFIGPHGERVLQMHTPDMHLTETAAQSDTPRVAPVSSAPVSVETPASIEKSLPLPQPPTPESENAMREDPPQRPHVAPVNNQEHSEPASEHPRQEPGRNPRNARNYQEPEQLEPVSSNIHRSSTNGVSTNGWHAPAESSLDPLTDTLVRVASTNGARLTGAPAPSNERDDAPQHRVQEEDRPVATMPPEPYRQEPQQPAGRRRRESTEEFPEESNAAQGFEGDEPLVRDSFLPPSPHRRPRPQSPSAQQPRHRHTDEFDEDPDTSGDEGWS